MFGGAAGELVAVGAAGGAVGSVACAPIELIRNIAMISNEIFLFML